MLRLKACLTITLMAMLGTFPTSIAQAMDKTVIDTNYSITSIIDPSISSNIHTDKLRANLKPEIKVENIELIGPINLHKLIPVILENSIDSKFIRVGDNITATLKENLYYGLQLIAPANAVLKGHILSLRNGRTLGESSLKDEDRFKSNATIEIVFDSLYTDQDFFIAVNGKPVHQESTRMGTDGYFYGIAVDQHGKIIQGGRTLSKNQKQSVNALRAATALPLPGGILFNLAAAPMVMASVGAASPDIAFNKPLDSSISHKRLKGMAYGFVSSLPGVSLVQAVIEKGNEIVLSHGDELIIDLTISNQMVSQIIKPPSTIIAPPAASLPTLTPTVENLVVKAELLSDTQGRSNLPLKPIIPDTPNTISGLESAITH